VRDIAPRRHEYLPAPGDRDAELVYTLASEEPQLRDYWKMVVKRRRLLVLVFLAVLALGVLITASMTPLYTAIVTLKIEPQAPTEEMIKSGTTLSGGSSSYDYYQTQFALLKSRVLAATIIKKLDLGSNPAFLSPPDVIDRLRSRFFRFLNSVVNYVAEFLGFRAARQQITPPTGETAFELGVHPRLISRYLSFLAVTPQKNTRLVGISFTTPNPHLSQELAKTHATDFITMSLQTRFELTNEARDFLEKKLSDLKKKIASSEGAFNRFLQTHGVVSLEGNENIIVERLLDLNKRLTEARAKHIELETLSQTLKNKSFQHLSQVVTNPMITQLKGRLDSLEAEQAGLAAIFKPGHPRILELKQQISEARQRLSLEFADIVRGVETEYSVARARATALQNEVKRQQEAALNLKELGVDYTILQGEAAANRAVYDSLRRRLNEANISNDIALSNLQIVEPAEKPLSSSSPNVKLNLTLSTAIGLALGAGLALFREHLDTTLKTPADIWRTLSLPTLGIVPLLSSLPRRRYRFGRMLKRSLQRRLPRSSSVAARSAAPGLMTFYRPLSPLAESFRTIRSSLLLSQAEKPPQVLLITSAQTGDGKTTSTLNLAVAFAQSGHAAVVIDADLRKGSCHRLLQMPNITGLSHLLTSNLPIEEALQQTTMEGLSLLSRGTSLPNPADFMASQRMKQILQDLRHRYNFVLIDSPPALVMSDAAVLSKLCDGILLIVRSQKTTPSAASRAVELFEMVDARILGVVLNGVDMRYPDFADYRHYYKSYYAEATRNLGE
jgi:polysaccharide biosynthesis transport protein